jgi:hypothetical protein
MFRESALCGAPSAEFAPALDVVLHVRRGRRLALIQRQRTGVHFVGALQFRVAQARQLTLMQGDWFIADLLLFAARVHGEEKEAGWGKQRKTFRPA